MDTVLKKTTSAFLHEVPAKRGAETPSHPLRPVQEHYPVEATVDLISGKYKPLILWTLMEKTLRFSQLHKVMPCATPKVLTQQLRELEADALIRREVFPVVPPRVEYSLTDFGRSLRPVLEAVHRWGLGYLDGKRST